jgi:hypothetical protein
MSPVATRGMAAGAGGFVWSERSRQIVCTQPRPSAHRARALGGGAIHAGVSDREAMTHTHTYIYIYHGCVCDAQGREPEATRPIAARTSPPRGAVYRILRRRSAIDRVRKHPHHTTAERVHAG